jgi:hypothetical protein
MNLKTIYRNRDGLLTVVEVFHWNTEITLVRSETNEVLMYFGNVVGVTRTGDWLQFTAVDPFSGSRQELKVELESNSRPMLELSPR